MQGLHLRRDYPRAGLAGLKWSYIPTSAAVDVFFETHALTLCQLPPLLGLEHTERPRHISVN